MRSPSDSGQGQAEGWRGCDSTYRGSSWIPWRLLSCQKSLCCTTCHLRVKIWEWIFVLIDIVLRILGLFFIYKTVTILICRSKTAVWLPFMKPDTKFSAASVIPFCSNKRHSGNQTCRPHTRDCAMNFLLGWSKLSVRNLQTILRKVTRKHNILAPGFQYPNCGPFK